MSFFVRRAMRLPQIRSQVASITQRRGLADAAGKDGAAKVNFWEQPLNPRNWNDHSVVFVSILVSFPIYIYYNLERLEAAAAEDKLRHEKQRREILESLKSLFKN